MTLAHYFLGRGGGGGGGGTSMSSNEMPVIPFLNPATIRSPFSNHVCLRSMKVPSLENETHTVVHPSSQYLGGRWWVDKLQQSFVVSFNHNVYTTNPV